MLVLYLMLNVLVSVIKSAFDHGEFTFVTTWV